MEIRSDVRDVQVRVGLTTSVLCRTDRLSAISPRSCRPVNAVGPATDGAVSADEDVDGVARPASIDVRAIAASSRAMNGAASRRTRISRAASGGCADLRLGGVEKKGHIETTQRLVPGEAEVAPRAECRRGRGSERHPGGPPGRRCRPGSSVDRYRSPDHGTRRVERVEIASGRRRRLPAQSAARAARGIETYCLVRKVCTGLKPGSPRAAEITTRECGERDGDDLVSAFLDVVTRAEEALGLAQVALDRVDRDMTRTRPRRQ